MTEEEFALSQGPEDSHVFPVAVLVACLALLVGGQSLYALMQGGLAAAVGIGMFSVIGFALSFGICIPIALLVGKMFGEDYGSLGVVSLRISAACALSEVLGVVVAATMGTFMLLVLGIPIVMIGAVWLVGMSAGHAIVYAFLCSVAKFVATLLFLSAIAATLLGASA